jgi:hypothetical protein
MKFIYVLVIVTLIGMAGMLSGCLSQEPTGYELIKDINDNQKAMLSNQDVLLNRVNAYNGQVNNKMDTILSEQRRQSDLTQMLIYEIRKQTQGNAAPIKLEIIVDRGGYGETSTFNSIDDAIKYIETLR